MSASLALNPGEVWAMIHAKGLLAGDVARRLHVHPSAVFAALAEHRPAVEAAETRKMKSAGENHWATRLPTHDTVQRLRAAELLNDGVDYEAIRVRLGIHHATLEKMPEYRARRRADEAERLAMESAVYRMSYDEGKPRDLVCSLSGLHLDAVMGALHREWKRRNGAMRFKSPFPVGGWRGSAKAHRMAA